MDEFKIKFRGVRGSYPVPHKDFLKYGGKQDLPWEENDLPLTLFQENFLTYLNKHHITDLKHLFYNHSKKEIAKMAIYVKDEAIKNNQEAKTLLFLYYR